MVERIATSVRLPADLLERLDLECDARLVSRNLVITRAIGFFLDALPPLDLPTGGAEHAK